MNQSLKSTMAWEYTDKVKDLFLSALYAMPESFYGEIEDADGRGTHGSIACGDAIKFYIKVKKHHDPKKDKIIQARYQTFGCTSAIASSEALCAIIESKRITPLNALKLTNRDIVDFLGGMPPEKIHCSVMGAEVLRSTIYDWAIQREIDIETIPELQIIKKEIQADDIEDEGTIICSCFALTDRYIKSKIETLKLKSLDEVEYATKAGGGCGSCSNAPGGVYDLLLESGSIHLDLATQNKKKGADIDYDSIFDIINSVVRPTLLAKNHDVELIEVKDEKIYCVFKKINSESSTIDFDNSIMRNTVEKFLREMVNESILVIDC